MVPFKSRIKTKNVFQLTNQFGQTNMFQCFLKLRMVPFPGRPLDLDILGVTANGEVNIDTIADHK